MHDADDAYSIQIPWWCHWLDKFLTLAINTWIYIETFNISLDLSTINFAYFSGCWASVLYGCHSILECYNLFSGVEYKTVLFYYSNKEVQEPSGTESYSKNFYKFSSKSDLHN